MDYISLFGIAVGLSMDAFAVSITNGAVLKKVNLLTALRIAACFGIFQGAMPIIGWSIRTTDTYSRPLDCSDSALLSWNQNDLGFSKKRRSRFLRKKHPKNKNIACNGGGNQY